MKVKFHANWRDDDYVYNWISKYTKDGKTWNDIEMVKGDDYDVIVIFNFPAPGLQYDKKRAIVFQGEPLAFKKNWGPWCHPNPKEFLHLHNTEDHFNSVGWSFNESYSELMNMDLSKKDKIISGVISNKTSLIGHRLDRDWETELK